MSGPLVISFIEEMDYLRSAWREAGDTVALVPTMGSLHEGHLALVKEASNGADHVVVSIFVNPLQFGPTEDFATYPRQLAVDQDFLTDTEVEVIFAPSVEGVYPHGSDSHPMLRAGKVGELFEGASRQGHFDGVVTVVKRLFDIVQPDSAVFGKKDAQQLFLIHQMVQGEKVPVALFEVDTVRSADGVALSSRNAYLSESERELSTAIPRALRAATQAPTIADALDAARGVLETTEGISVDYLEVVDPQTFQVTRDSNPALMIVAVVVGSTRLIDNQVLTFHQ